MPEKCKLMIPGTAEYIACEGGLEDGFTLSQDLSKSLVVTGMDVGNLSNRLFFFAGVIVF